jgi:hypothetical protein
MEYEHCSSTVIPKPRPPARFLSEIEDIWDWPSIPASQREDKIQRVQHQLNLQGYSCPYFNNQEVARIPLAIWVFTMVFFAVYQLGRQIEVMGKRICE